MRSHVGCRLFFLMVWCKDGGEMDAEGCRRLDVDVNSCYCVIGGFSRGVGVGGDDLMLSW